MTTLISLLLACHAPPMQARDGQPSAVVLGAQRGYVALAGEGIGVVDPETGETVQALAPPEGVDGVHDLATYNALLLALDARPPGHLMSYRIARDGSLELVDGPREVAVGDFSGLSMHNGTWVVAGGAEGLTVGSYTGDGRLGAEVSRLRPESQHYDVVVDATGLLAYASVRFHTRNEGERYGLISLRLNPPPQAPEVLDRLYLPGAGRAPGQMQPAGYPMSGWVQHDTLFLAHGPGLGVIDVSDPADMKVKVVQVLPVFGVDVAVEAERAWVVGSKPTPYLVELDVRRPDQPMLLDSLVLPPEAVPTGVAVRKGQALIAANGGGLLREARRPPPKESLVEYADDPVGQYLDLLDE
ncbi:MAG: hypothetical protein H6741_30260 [Alphaproteobacteria bacterium]|nr:hypothetical protein [Alphaproteobacteria bacterium]